MKVIHILHELKFSGAEIMYVDAATIFQGKGCELTVMATAKDLGEYAIFFKQAGYKVIHRPIPQLKNYLNRIKYYLAFIRLIKTEKINVVHNHSHQIMWGMALCSWLANVRSVYTFHNVFPSHTLTYLYHCLLRWSAKYIFNCRFQTISDSVYNHELKYYHNKTIKIYNWYGSSRYFPGSKEEKFSIRKDLGIEDNAFVLISVGGCSPVKRHSDIINALPQIIEKIPDCLYLHLGKGISETEEIQLAKESGVSEYIRFCGNQTNVRNYLVASDVYLMPSRFEGIPITTIEAMACMIPSVLYDVPGLRDFNKTGENCILIPEDFTILGEQIIKVWANTKISDEIASRAKYFVNKYFNMKTNVDRIFELYI